MTERVLGSTGGQRRRRLAFVLPFMALAALILVIAVAARSRRDQAGFEDDDGNLAPAAPINFDWNSFAPTTWAGTAPFLTSTKEFSGWAFTDSRTPRLRPATAPSRAVRNRTTPSKVNGAKAPNKDDLKRVYVGTSRPLAATSSSSCLGPYPAEHDIAIGPHRLRVQPEPDQVAARRVLSHHLDRGDMLIVYD